MIYKISVEFNVYSIPLLQTSILRNQSLVSRLKNSHCDPCTWFPKSNPIFKTISLYRKLMRYFYGIDFGDKFLFVFEQDGIFLSKDIKSFNSLTLNLVCVELFPNVF